MTSLVPRHVRPSAAPLLAVMVSFVISAALGCGSYDVPNSRDQSFNACCGGAGTCVAQALVDEKDAKRLSVDSCGEGLLCAPSELSKPDKALLQTCTTALNGAEGRCLPGCLPEVQNRTGVARDDCAEGKICAPCFDPLDGTDTGACHVGIDPGPVKPPTLFGNCCGSVGRCIPQQLVQGDDRSRLSVESCTQPTDLCVPSPLAKDAQWTPQTCRAKGTKSEGRCLPACLPDVAARERDLGQESCPAEYLCAPCFDPLTGQSTKACDVGGDTGPKDPVMQFATCCGEQGRCIPSSLISPADAPRLDANTCVGSDLLCAPEWLAKDPKAVAPRCVVSATQAEGRCLSECLPDLAKRGQQLRQDSCSVGQLCAPCFDPLDGSSTGACSLGGDPGPSTPAVTFEKCCGGVGTCVPNALVVKVDTKRLGKDSCQQAETLCVPESFARDFNYTPMSCTVSKFMAEGRCLPSCLPAVAAQSADLLADGCASPELCTPCFSPVDGSNTGACNLGGDPGPKTPPSIFADCCGDISRCVPKALIPASQVSTLSTDSCTGATDLCLPESLLLDPDSIFPSCALRGSKAEGRCLPACLPSVASQKDKLEQLSCEAGRLCTPCFDPFTGAATGACGIGGDTGPKQPSKPFGECGGKLGRCIPGELVSAAEKPRLTANECTTPGDLCVPEPLAKDPKYVFPSCTTSNMSAEGRCLPRFLPAIAAQASQLAQDGCTEGALCSPCYEPFDGAPTGACTLGGDTGPKQPPTLFADCCGDIGRCIPRGLVNMSQQERVGRDSCASASNLCVPEPLARNPDHVFSSCSVSSTGAEGRCLPGCLPEIAARAGKLTQESCPSGHLCSPCFDPVTGNSTAACNVGKDPGPTKPPVTFDYCCNSNGDNRGRCVPRSQVPASSQSQLGQDSCQKSDFLCAPAESVADESFIPPYCQVPNTGAEGRCLLNCLPSVGSKGGALTVGSCQDTQRCVPCYSPADGTTTGACNFAPGDSPKEPPIMFATCCGDGGECVPIPLLPASSTSLPAQNCPPDSLCAPKQLVIYPDSQLPTCESDLGIGRCIAACFLTPDQAFWSSTGRCQNNDLCLSCDFLPSGICK